MDEPVGILKTVIWQKSNKIYDRVNSIVTFRDKILDDNEKVLGFYGVPSDGTNV